jgi:hypothetical protein
VKKTGKNRICKKICANADFFIKKGFRLLLFINKFDKIKATLIAKRKEA